MRIHPLIMTVALIGMSFLSRSTGSSQTNLESQVAGPVGLLSSEDHLTRFKAGEALCQLGVNAAPAIPAIMRLLENEPDKFHDVMIRVLENCPKEAEAFKPALEKALQSPNPQIRISCARTLWVLDPAQANQVRPVARQSLSEPAAGIRIEGASLLWHLDHDAEAVVPTLIALLSDQEMAYDFRTLKFLGDIGPAAKEVMPAIQTWLKSERWRYETSETNAAVAALQKIEGGP